MSKLHKYAFSDLYDISSGISSTKEQAGHGAPFVSFSTVFNNYFLPDELPDFMDTSAVDQERCSVKKGDILITRTSETVDELAMSCVVLKDYPKATFSGFVKRLRPKTTGIAYDKYMAFFLRSEYFRKVINAKTIMTLRASFNEDIFSFLDLYLPDYEEQVKIGDFLYNIEKKIQCNKKINDNLQHQLKLLYDYWFTQFDFPDENGKPYRASGGAMVWNEQLKRDIPAGWGANNLGEHCDILLGGTPDTSNDSYWNGTINWLNSGEVSQFPVVSSALRITQMGLDSSATKLMPANTVVVSITGNIRASILAIDTCANQSVVGILESEELKSQYIYPYMCNLIKHYTSVSTGNCQQHINKGTIEDSYILIPDNGTLETYYHKTELLYKQIIKNALEILKLTSLRDWLLPMLMNGQVGFKKEREEKSQIKVSGFEQWLANQGFAARGDVDMDVLRDIYEAMDSDDK